MSGACGLIDARLADFRSVRQRCAGALRAALRDAERLSGAGAPEDRREALEVERKAAAAALELLLTPAVPLEPLRTKAEREISFTLELLDRPERTWPQERPNRMRRPAVEPEPAAAAAPEPPAPPAPEPQLSGWRAARARRLQAAGVR